jgi:hypothetical protein
MAQPTFYSEGTTPRQRDTRLVKWKKVLGKYQDSLSGANSANDPRQRDSLRPTLKKINNALTGTT